MAPTRHVIEGEAAVSPEGTATAHAEVLNALRELRGRVKHVEGSVVATTDGMVIAHDLAASEAYAVEPEGVAALSAVNLGLSQRITDTASHGELQVSIIRGAFGHVLTYAAGDRALLTVLVRAECELEPLHADARQVADRVAELLADTWQDDAATWEARPSTGTS